MVVPDALDDVLSGFVKSEAALVIMDIGLPFYNGYYWCAQIRTVSKAPVLFLSSASDKMNIVLAMQMGGDDFVPKPFDMEVLLAKLEALLRRSYAFGAGESTLYAHKGAVLKPADATLFFEGKSLELTRNELRILKLLMENVGAFVSRDSIMQALWASDSFIDDNTLTVNITRLRKRLEGIGLTDFIQTRKGVGYALM